MATAAGLLPGPEGGDGGGSAEYFADPIFDGDDAGVDKLRAISEKFLGDLWAANAASAPYEMMRFGL